MRSNALFYWPVLISLIAIAAACSQSNNLLFGRVKATLGSHIVEVTDCYRTSVPSPKRSGDDYRFMPCRDADVLIRDETLSVNGLSYGHLNSNDSILVDHGVVSVTVGKSSNNSAR